MNANLWPKNQDAQLALIALAGLVAVYFIGKSVLSGAANAAGAVVSGTGGILSGNNALTKGTPYQGWGVVGTLGAATNSVLGGAPAAVGNWIGNLISPMPPTPAIQYAPTMDQLTELPLPTQGDPLASSGASGSY